MMGEPGIAIIMLFISMSGTKLAKPAVAALLVAELSFLTRLKGQLLYFD